MYFDFSQIEPDKLQTLEIINIGKYLSEVNEKRNYVKHVKRSVKYVLQHLAAMDWFDELWKSGIVVTLKLSLPLPWDISEYERQKTQTSSADFCN